MPEIRIRNKTTFEEYDVDAEWIFYIGRPSPLGNPFPINKQVSRRRSIDAFREHLPTLRADTKEWIEIAKMKCLYERDHDIDLVCWCDPKPCHGEVIADAVRGYIEPKSEDENIFHLNFEDRIVSIFERYGHKEYLDNIMEQMGFDKLKGDSGAVWWLHKSTEMVVVDVRDLSELHLYPKEAHVQY